MNKKTAIAMLYIVGIGCLLSLLVDVYGNPQLMGSSRRPSVKNQIEMALEAERVATDAKIARACGVPVESLK